MLAAAVWFLWLGLGLTLVGVGGAFVRRRLLDAATGFGMGARGRGVLRWASVWLLLGYPVIAFSIIGLSLLFGSDRIDNSDSLLFTWLLVYPFYLTVLVVVQSLPWLLAIEVVRRVRRRRPTERRYALAVVVAVGAFAVYTPARIVWQHGELRWRHHVVQVRGDGENRPPPFRIGFIADLQQDAHTDGERAAEVIDRMNGERPDIVLSGGDWINVGPDHIEGAARSAGRARSRLGTFSVRGDHEHFVSLDRERSVAAVTAAMQRQGVSMLHNEVRRFDHHGRTIAVVFLTYNYPSRTPRPAIERLLDATAGADVTILVTHQLDATTAALARDRVDLILAAHTHGGQVNPVLGLWHVPLARLETPYIDGRYQLGRTTIIVTAGVGYSLVPFRYASVGSVETIDLVWL